MDNPLEGRIFDVIDMSPRTLIADAFGLVRSALPQKPETYHERIGTVGKPAVNAPLTLIDEGTRVALEKLPEASAKDAAVIAGVAQDKLRLLNNQPTRINATQDMSDLARQFKALADSYKARDAKVVSVQEPDSDPERS